MENWNLTSGAARQSGLLAPVTGQHLGDVCPKQVRDRVGGTGTSARFAIVLTGAFGTVTGPHSWSPPL
jgi:hypothetical protein